MHLFFIRYGYGKLLIEIITLSSHQFVYKRQMLRGNGANEVDLIVFSNRKGNTFYLSLQIFSYLLYLH